MACSDSPNVRHDRDDLIVAALAAGAHSLGARPLGLGALVGLLVGGHDALHELVAHHVAAVEVDEGDVAHVGQHLGHGHEAGLAPAG